MCSRFHVGEKLIGRLETSFPELAGKLEEGDVCPSQTAAVLFGVPGRDGKNFILDARMMRWGYEMAASARLLINARAETIRHRPAFREDFTFRRCVIPAEYFYEWKKADKERTKYEFSDPGKILWMAGIFRWVGDNGRFVVVTTAANQSMAPVHDRMPVVMEAGEVKGWLQDPEYGGVILERKPKELTGTLAEDSWEQLSLFEWQRR